MKTKTKGIWAAIGFICSIGAYYYLSLAIEWIWSDICAKHYCMKTLSLAEFLAIEAALIGVYFVVSSLDDWKHQDKFQTAKINLVKLHEIDSILLTFKNNLYNFDECYVKYYTNSLSDNEITETNSFKKYKAIKSHLKIQDKIEECDLDINTKSINLFQNDFESCISLAKKYIQEIDKEVIQINNERRVHINSRITKQEDDKKTEKEKINNMPDGFLKTLAEVSLGAARISSSEETTLYSDLIKLDINLEDFKKIIESKNNEYIKFSNSLKNIQNKVNKY
ncbi:hypothetical protein [Acinetobacter cumulans]|uniref:hypothetical protein n=1 Tax=Acinetobacter cumulans TaxID=2136182 RepID=UPI0014439B02|nr:hypothetical protein [Acinetobacter cumulans]